MLAIIMLSSHSALTVNNKNCRSDEREIFETHNLTCIGNAQGESSRDQILMIFHSMSPESIFVFSHQHWYRIEGSLGKNCSERIWACMSTAVLFQ